MNLILVKMQLNDTQRAHVKSLCTRHYREVDQMIKALEFSDWKDESKEEVKKWLNHQKALSDSILKEASKIQLNPN